MGADGKSKGQQAIDVLYGPTQNYDGLQVKQAGKLMEAQAKDLSRQLLQAREALQLVDSFLGLMEVGRDGVELAQIKSLRDLIKAAL